MRAHEAGVGVQRDSVSELAAYSTRLTRENDALLHIRTASTNDIVVITEFNCRLAEETEKRILDRAIVWNGVKRGLAVGKEVRYFLAEDESGVIGQIMLTREWSDWRDGWMIWLQSVFVIPEKRGCGVFRALLTHAIADVASCTEAVNVRLYVDHENEAAKASYRRIGFQSSGYEIMEMPLDRK